MFFLSLYNFAVRSCIRHFWNRQRKKEETKARFSRFPPLSNIFLRFVRPWLGITRPGGSLLFFRVLFFFFDLFRSSLLHLEISLDLRLLVLCEDLYFLLIKLLDSGGQRFLSGSACYERFVTSDQLSRTLGCCDDDGITALNDRLLARLNVAVYGFD